MLLRGKIPTFAVPTNIRRNEHIVVVDKLTPLEERLVSLRMEFS
jgi:hypothetical protein